MLDDFVAWATGCKPVMSVAGRIIGAGGVRSRVSRAGGGRDESR